MDCTACGTNCPFVKIGFCQSDKDCPNYIESWWTEGEGKQPKLIKDCSPKRMIIQQQYIQTRIEQFQTMICESRNEYNKLSEYLRNLIEMSQTVLQYREQPKQIESKESYEKYIQLDTNNSIPMHHPV